MPKWTHAIFAAIWLVTALVFARLAYDSFEASKTSLARFSVQFPKWGTVKIMGIDLPEILTQMANTNNKNTDALEESIRSTAKLTLRLNTISFLMACMGLAAQIGVYHRDRR
jgi:hypothetical protein